MCAKLYQDHWIILDIFDIENFCILKSNFVYRMTNGVKLI